MRHDRHLPQWIIRACNHIAVLQHAVHQLWRAGVRVCARAGKDISNRVRAAMQPATRTSRSATARISVPDLSAHLTYAWPSGTGSSISVSLPRV